MIAYGDLNVEPITLPSDIDDSSFGENVRKALCASKQVSLAEFQNIWSSGAIGKWEADRELLLMKRYGYKTKRAMYRKMNCCWISASEGQIGISPAHHKTIDGYTANKTDGPFPIYVAETISDAELGAALRQGFSLCTSAIA